MRKIPILMYHEISTPDSLMATEKMMTPSYFVDKKIFRRHLEKLSSCRFQTPSLDDIQKRTFSPERKIIILTFDDGWLGNAKNALPLLKEFGFTAIVFVCTDLIGTTGYMDWPDLKACVNAGISIQSHAQSHEPLEMTGKKQLLDELSNSKRLLEGRLGIKVTALSFPHGSYNAHIVDVATRIGYRVFFSSDLTCNAQYYQDSRFNLFGRVAITSGIDDTTFERIIECHKLFIVKYAFLKRLKTRLRRLIGINRYRKLYRLYHRIED
jgi:peptidoglycan/xylan/chitin deacetylase (PgdA/CDA1 family)